MYPCYFPRALTFLGLDLRVQIVVVIGSSASAVDISRDISQFAKEVHVASRGEVGGTVKQPGYDNFWLHPMVVNMIYSELLSFSFYIETV